MRLVVSALLVGAEISFLLYLEGLQGGAGGGPLGGSTRSLVAPPAGAPGEPPAGDTGPARDGSGPPNPLAPPSDGIASFPSIPPPAPPPPAEAAPPPAVRVVAYRVRSRESLIGIARRHGLDWQEVARMNGIDDPKRLRAGQLLNLPAARRDAPPRRR